MRRSDGVGVAAPTRYAPVRGELEDRGRQELEPRLVLRKVDGAAGPGALPSLERSKHGDRSISDGDIVDVRPVEKDRGRVGLAEELNESGEGTELAAVSGMERVRSSLSLIAARQDDEPGVIRTQLPRSQAEARNGAGREALDEHVGRADERSRESHTLGMLQVERRASLPVVVEGEHARAIGLDDAVLKWRVRRAEHVGGKSALETDDLGAEIREVLSDERSRRREADLHDADTAERSATGRRGGSGRDLGHMTPASRSRASSRAPTPTSP